MWKLWLDKLRGKQTTKQGSPSYQVEGSGFVNTSFSTTPDTFTLTLVNLGYSPSALLVAILSNPASQVQRRENVQLIKALIESGAEVVGSRQQGEGAEIRLYMAVMQDKPQVVRLLLDRGIPADAGEKEGYSGLLAAAKTEDKHMIDLLLDRGININVQDKDGETALMEAAEYGLFQSVQALLERHANVNLKDKKGRTAFSKAQSLTAGGRLYDTFLRGRQAGIMNLLYQAGAKE